jgi:hypothetical protein
VRDVTIKMEPGAEQTQSVEGHPPPTLPQQPFDQSLTPAEFIRSFSNISLKYNLDGKAGQEILNLFKSAGDLQNFLGLKDVEKILFSEAQNLQEVSYCKTCYAKISGPSCKSCRGKDSANQALVVKNDIKSQLKHLLEHKGLAEILEKQSFPRENHGSTIKDVTDGLRFKTLPRTSKFDVSFILGYFSVPRHVGFGKWYLVSALAIAELDPVLREQFLILNEVWCLPQTGMQTKQLQYASLMDTFETLPTQGITWTCPWSDQEVNSKAFVLGCAAEQKALIEILQGLQVGCNLCEQKVDKPARLMPYLSPKKRPMLDHCKVLRQTVDKSRAASGNLSKSMSPLLLIPHCNVVDAFAAGCHLRLFSPWSGVVWIKCYVSYFFRIAPSMRDYFYFISL